MKFTLPSKAFSEAISAAGKIIESRGTIPILANIAIKARNDEIVLTSTDLDIEIQMSVAAGVIEPGSTTIPSRLASDIAKKMVSEITFSMEDGNQQATLSAGRSRFQLMTLPTEDYPSIAAGDFSHSFTLSGDDIVRLFGKVEFAQSTEETRYYLNGCFFHDLDGQKLRAVATDGHRLARAEIDIPSDAIGMPSIIIPRKTVKELLSLASAAKDNEIRIDVSDSKIRMTSGTTVLTSKLVQGTYPDYSRVIPVGNNLFARVDAKTLSGAADRVSTISTERGRAVKMRLENGSMTLMTSSPEAGSAEDVIDLDWDADPFEIGANAKYVADVLRALGDGEVKITLGDAGSPMIFENEKEPGLLVLLMPLRV